jgi:hypothetical protein
MHYSLCSLKANAGTVASLGIRHCNVSHSKIKMKSWILCQKDQLCESKLFQVDEEEFGREKLKCYSKWRRRYSRCSIIINDQG